MLVVVTLGLQEFIGNCFTCCSFNPMLEFVLSVEAMPIRNMACCLFFLAMLFVVPKCSSPNRHAVLKSVDKFIVAPIAVPLEMSTHEMSTFKMVYYVLCITGSVRAKFQVGQGYSSQARRRVLWLMGWLGAASIFQIKAPMVAVTIANHLQEVQQKLNWNGGLIVSVFGIIITRCFQPFMFLLGVIVGPFFERIEERSLLVDLTVTVEIIAWFYVPCLVGDGMVLLLCDFMHFGIWLAQFVIRGVASLIHLLIAALNFPRFALCVANLVAWLDRRAPGLITYGRDCAQRAIWKSMCWCFARLRKVDNAVMMLGIRPHEWANLGLSVLVSLRIQFEQKCVRKTQGLLFWEYWQWTTEYCEPWTAKDWWVSLNWSVWLTLLRMVYEFTGDSPETRAKKEAAEWLAVILGRCVQKCFQWCGRLLLFVDRWPTIWFVAHGFLAFVLVVIGVDIYRIYCVLLPACVLALVSPIFVAINICQEELKGGM